MKNFFNKFVFIMAFGCAPCFVKGLIIDVTFPGVPLEKDSQGNLIPTVRVGEQFRLKIVIDSDENNEFVIHAIEGLDKLTVSHPMVSQEMSLGFSSSAGKTSRRKEIHSYTAVSSQKGVEKIGPVSVRVDNKLYKSGAYYYQVIDAPKAQPQVPQVVGSPAPVMARQGSQPLLQCQLSTAQTKVFVGGAFEVSLQMYRSGPHVNYEVQPINFPGFSIKLGKAMPPREETIQGRVFEVREQKIIVTPLQVGSFQLGPVDIVYYARVKAPQDIFAAFFNAGFGVEQRTLQSNAIPLEVVPLPHYAGRVDAIGSFTQFQAAVDKHDAVINEPIKLTLTVEGKGDLATIEEPKLLLPAYYRFYKSKATVDEDGSGGGRKVFEFIVQVPKPGMHEIPPQKFVYFDTVHKQYKTLLSQKIELQILPDPESKQQQIDSSFDKGKKEPSKQHGNDAAKFHDDVSFIQESINFGSSAAKGIPWWLFSVLLFFPLLFVRNYIVVGLKRLVWRRLSDAKRRQLFAKKAEQELNQLLAKRDAGQVHEFFVLLCKQLFSIEQHEAADAEIEKKLHEAGWDFVVIQEFLDYLSASASLNFIAKNDEAMKSLVLKKAHYWFLLLIQDASHQVKKSI